MTRQLLAPRERIPPVVLLHIAAESGKQSLELGIGDVVALPSSVGFDGNPADEMHVAPINNRKRLWRMGGFQA